ncbi:MAG: hypothetical protein QOG67_3688 [Verrucomicrobiota bacterium]|jgi:gluconokinase
MATYPKSPKETAGGMRYFPRMLDKVRLHAVGELGLEYHANMGKPVSADGLCINFLRVNYNELCERVKRGGTDEEILEWCYENGRRLNEGDLTVWNNFMAKFGWNDFATPTLERIKKENGVSDRDDIKTIGEFIDFDEGRRK